MRNMISWLVLLVLVWLPRPATAQNLTVQQPVFGVNSVATTVSVPDRGSALLGGVNRAGASRKQYGFGPFRPGSSAGRFHSASSSSVGVYIHDFAAMDRELLDRAAGPATQASGVLRGSAARAWSSLARRSAGTAEQSRLTSTGSSAVAGSSASHEAAAAAMLSRSLPPASSSSSSAQSGSVVSAERSLRLGRAALERGATSLARLHFRMATRHGSSDARAELARLQAPRDTAVPLADAAR